MTNQMSATPDSDGEDIPEYRLEHLQDDIAGVFSDRGMVQAIAPLGKGGVSPRVSNRVTFSVSPSMTEPREVERILDSERFAWTHGTTTEGGVQFVVLGRAIASLRELRADDRIHVNKRGGPFKVYRVLEQPGGPEVLQRSDASVTAEVVNLGTGTDWMVVQWAGDDRPVAYVKTKDTNSGVTGDFRYKKVEDVERMGRVGPTRLFAPPVDATEDVDREVPELVAAAGDASGLEVHPSDLSRLETLFARPVPDVFTPADADVTRRFLTAMGEWYEREADALHVETEQDKQRAADQQDRARVCSRLTNAFNLLQMDAVDVTEDTDLWRCADCGQAFTNKHKFPTHRRDCPAKGDGEEQADDHAESGGEDS